MSSRNCKLTQSGYSFGFLGLLVLILTDRSALTRLCGLGNGDARSSLKLVTHPLVGYTGHQELGDRAQSLESIGPLVLQAVLRPSLSEIGKLHRKMRR